MLPYCSKREENLKEYSRTRFLLGTYVTIRAYSVFDAGPAIRRAFKEIERISRKYSFEREGSYLNNLNKGVSELDRETVTLLNFALKLCNDSNGAFDPTIGRLKLLWGFNKKPRLPAPEEIKGALKYVGAEKLKIKDNKFISKGIFLDFSAFAKGYAVDRAGEILKKEGINSFLIDAGGDIKVSGEKPGGEAWKIGIKNPLGKGIIKVIELIDGAIATSGDYENFFVKDGTRYHHLLNPKTGYPARGLHSVSVVAPTDMEADAFASAVFVMGKERAERFAVSHKIRVILVDDAGKIWDFGNSN